MSETETKTKESAKAVSINLSDVINMLNAGKTREEIGAHYGLNRANRIRLFQDESLKGIKTKTGSVFTLNHDVETTIDKKNKKATKVVGTTDPTAPQAKSQAEPNEAAVEAVAGENW